MLRAGKKAGDISVKAVTDAASRTGGRWAATVSIVAALGLIGTALVCSAEAQILGTTEGFGVLAGSTVTNTGSSVITGNLGVSPGSAVTGFPHGIVLAGTIHGTDAVAGQAQVDLTTAYNPLQGLPSQVSLTGLGGMLLSPAVYSLATSAQLTGVLSLNGQGNTGGGGVTTSMNDLFGEGTPIADDDCSKGAAHARAEQNPYQRASPTTFKHRCHTEIRPIVDARRPSTGPVRWSLHASASHTRRRRSQSHRHDLDDHARASYFNSGPSPNSRLHPVIRSSLSHDNSHDKSTRYSRNRDLRHGTNLPRHLRTQNRRSEGCRD